ncbi:MAG: starch synthase, partial [Oscillospiraceae bacterium]|nr:starch synthase [Oscillospiraceae bacterium]
FLMPSKSEPCGLAQMISVRYGTLPIIRETGGLKDSIQDATNGEGNGFTFCDYDGAALRDAVERALAVWSDKEKRAALVRDAMQCDFSWGRSANAYIRLYRQMLKDEAE